MQRPRGNLSKIMTTVSEVEQRWSRNDLTGESLKLFIVRNKRKILYSETKRVMFFSV